MTPILLIHQGALGDLVLSLPTLYALRVFSSQAAWTMAGNPETLSLLDRRFYAQKVISIHHREWAGLFQEKSKLPKSFRDYLASFQRAYVFSRHETENLIRGLHNAGLKKTIWLPSLPDVQKGLSLQTMQKQILASEKIPWVEEEQTIFPNAADLQKAEETLTRTGGKGPWWAIHPGSGSPHKNWPWECFIDTARGISRQTGYQPIFLLGPVEEENSPGLAEKTASPGFPIFKELPLPVLAGVLSRCAGYLGNDSGVSHLAAALGIPVVVLFGPTDPEIWAPRGKRVRVLQSSLPCIPCSLEGARSCPEKVCLDSLEVSRVLDHILAIIQG